MVEIFESLNFGNNLETQIAVIALVSILVNIYFGKELKKEKGSSKNAWNENANLINALQAKDDSEKFSVLANNKELLGKYKKGEKIKVYGITFFTLSGNFKIDIDVTKSEAEQIRDAWHHEMLMAFQKGETRFVPSSELTDEYPECLPLNFDHVVSFLPHESVL